jgi:hypothetical protein
MPLWVQAVWKLFSHPNNCKQPGVMDLDAIGGAYFCCIGSGVKPGASSGDLNPPGAHNMTRSSSPHRGQERFNTDDVHHSREVVSKHVQRHLGRHLWQRLH